MSLTDFDDSRAGLTYACANMADIRDALAQAREADALVEAVRSGGDVPAALTALHEAMLRAGDPLGVLGHDIRSGQAVPGLPARRAEIVYLCPVTVCSRIAWAPGSCELSGEELRWKRLPSERSP
jgi:hypothetical protein